jgi:sulfur-oxidizing protein SoxB
MRRREFLQAIAAAAVAGLPLDAARAADDADGERFYGALAPFGNVALLHITDCHAQLRPLHFREPSVNLGVGNARGQPPHLVGDALLRHFGIAAGTREATHSRTSISSVQRARMARWAVSRISPR